MLHFPRKILFLQLAAAAFSTPSRCSQLTHGGVCVCVCESKEMRKELAINPSKSQGARGLQSL